MKKEIEPIYNLHESWWECWDYISGAKKFQNLAIECIREQEKRFQRGTEPDKLVLQSLELAREILLNLKYKEIKYKSTEDKDVEEIYQRENDKIQSEKESSFVTVPQEKTVSDLWRIAQKYNCDDFIQIIDTLNIKIIYKDA
jgi:hypothetical protein